VPHSKNTLDSLEPELLSGEYHLLPSNGSVEWCLASYVNAGRVMDVSACVKIGMEDYASHVSQSVELQVNMTQFLQLHVAQTAHVGTDSKVDDRIHIEVDSSFFISSHPSDASMASLVLDAHNDAVGTFALQFLEKPTPQAAVQRIEASVSGAYNFAHGAPSYTLQAQSSVAWWDRLLSRAVLGVVIEPSSVAGDHLDQVTISLHESADSQSHLAANDSRIVGEYTGHATTAQGEFMLDIHGQATWHGALASKLQATVNVSTHQQQAAIYFTETDISDNAAIASSVSSSSPPSLVDAAPSVRLGASYSVTWSGSAVDTDGSSPPPSPSRQQVSLINLTGGGSAVWKQELVSVAQLQLFIDPHSDIRVFVQEGTGVHDTRLLVSYALHYELASSASLVTLAGQLVYREDLLSQLDVLFSYDMPARLIKLSVAEESAVATGPNQQLGADYEARWVHVELNGLTITVNGSVVVNQELLTNAVLQLQCSGTEVGSATIGLREARVSPLPVNDDDLRIQGDYRADFSFAATPYTLDVGGQAWWYRRPQSIVSISTSIGRDSSSLAFREGPFMNVERLSAAYTANYTRSWSPSGDFMEQEQVDVTVAGHTVFQDELVSNAELAFALVQLPTAENWQSGQVSVSLLEGPVNMLSDSTARIDASYGTEWQVSSGAPLSVAAQGRTIWYGQGVSDIAANFTLQSTTSASPNGFSISVKEGDDVWPSRFGSAYDVSWVAESALFSTQVSGNTVFMDETQANILFLLSCDLHAGSFFTQLVDGLLLLDPSSPVNRLGLQYSATFPSDSNGGSLDNGVVHVTAQGFTHWERAVLTNASVAFWLDQGASQSAEQGGRVRVQVAEGTSHILDRFASAYDAQWSLEHSSFHLDVNGTVQLQAELLSNAALSLGCTGTMAGVSYIRLREAPVPDLSSANEQQLRVASQYTVDYAVDNAPYVVGVHGEVWLGGELQSAVNASTVLYGSGADGKEFSLSVSEGNVLPLDPSTARVALGYSATWSQGNFTSSDEGFLLTAKGITHWQGSVASNAQLALNVQVPLQSATLTLTETNEPGDINATSARIQVQYATDWNVDTLPYSVTATGTTQWQGALVSDAYLKIQCSHSSEPHNRAIILSASEGPSSARSRFSAYYSLDYSLSASGHFVFWIIGHTVLQAEPLSNAQLYIDFDMDQKTGSFSLFDVASLNVTPDPTNSRFGVAYSGQFLVDASPVTVDLEGFTVFQRATVSNATLHVLYDSTSTNQVVVQVAEGTTPEFDRFQADYTAHWTQHTPGEAISIVVSGHTKLQQEVISNAELLLDCSGGTVGTANIALSEAALLPLPDKDSPLLRVSGNYLSRYAFDSSPYTLSVSGLAMSRGDIYSSADLALSFDPSRRGQASVTFKETPNSPGDQSPLRINATYAASYDVEAVDFSVQGNTAWEDRVLSGFHTSLHVDVPRSAHLSFVEAPEAAASGTHFGPEQARHAIGLGYMFMEGASDTPSSSRIIPGVLVGADAFAKISWRNFFDLEASVLYNAVAVAMLSADAALAGSLTSRMLHMATDVARIPLALSLDWSSRYTIPISVQLLLEEQSCSGASCTPDVPDSSTGGGDSSSGPDQPSSSTGGPEPAHGGGSSSSWSSWSKGKRAGVTIGTIIGGIGLIVGILYCCIKRARKPHGQTGGLNTEVTDSYHLV